MLIFLKYREKMENQLEASDIIDVTLTRLGTLNLEVTLSCNYTMWTQSHSFASVEIPATGFPPWHEKLEAQT